ncbi:hypothetical protein JVU11DRAFT_4503 [Chiua virens]|nr:hypothetical protein JVU11DRAFT_4503 [Chiua virens]
MSSESSLVSFVASIQQNNYVTLAIIIAVAYDYVLTFLRELKYIWSKPWSRVSTLFVLVRYCGLFSVIIPVLFGSSFLPHAKVREILDIMSLWTYVLFLGAADIVMILRIWAMYHRSRLILVVLIALYVIEMTSAVIASGFYSKARVGAVTTIVILEYSLCVVGVEPTWGQVTNVMQIAFAVALCLLAIIQFVKQSLQMYRITKQWQPNLYMKLLVKQGVLYFFAIFLINFVDILSVSGNIPNSGWQPIFLYIVQFVPAYTLTPRFIMSIRELYASDLQGRRVGGLDTGFGLVSVSNGSIAGTTIAFAEAEQTEGMEVEEIPMQGWKGLGSTCR